MEQNEQYFNNFKKGRKNHRFHYFKKNWKLEELEKFEIISRCIRRYKNWFLPTWMVSAIAGYFLYIQLI